MQLFPTTEAARLLNTSVQNISLMVLSGRLECYQAGPRARLFSQAQLDAYRKNTAEALRAELVQLAHACARARRAVFFWRLLSWQRPTAARLGRQKRARTRQRRLAMALGMARRMLATVNE